MVKKFETWEYEPQPSTKERTDIIGLPSGEVISLKTIFVLNTLINEDLVVFVDSWANNKTINSYCFDDRNRERVLNIIDNEY